MPDINHEAMQTLLYEHFMDFHEQAYEDVRDTPAYQAATQQGKRIEQKHRIVVSLYHGDKEAIGHTITDEERLAFQDYHETLTAREDVILAQMLYYAFCLGSGLKDRFGLGPKLPGEQT